MMKMTIARSSTRPSSAETGHFDRHPSKVAIIVLFYREAVWKTCGDLVDWM